MYTAVQMDGWTGGWTVAMQMDGQTAGRTAGQWHSVVCRWTDERPVL